jgi:hypothetical protein
VHDGYTDFEAWAHDKFGFDPAELRDMLAGAAKAAGDGEDQALAAVGARVAPALAPPAATARWPGRATYRSCYAQEPGGHSRRMWRK